MGVISFVAAGAALAGSAENSLLGVLLVTLTARVRALVWTLLEWLGATCEFRSRGPRPAGMTPVSRACHLRCCRLYPNCCRQLPPPLPVDITMRYSTGPSCWLLFGWVFWHQPILRLPLMAYHVYIISPAGRRAVGTSRWPWLLRWSPIVSGAGGMGQQSAPPSLPAGSRRAPAVPAALRPTPYAFVVARRQPLTTTCAFARACLCPPPPPHPPHTHTVPPEPRHAPLV